MRTLMQIAAVTSINLRSIPLRLGNSLVIVIGIAGVVAVLIPLLAMSVGFAATIRGDGRDDRAIVLARNAQAEDESSLSRQTVSELVSAAQIRRDARGKPLASAEVILAAPVARKRDQTDVSVTLRGVGEQYFAMRPELALVSGRMFRPGTRELLAGAAALKQFAGLEVGDKVRLQEGDWTVVGVFSGSDGSRESELIADAQTVMSAYKLQSFNSLMVTLRSADDFVAFKDGLTRDSRWFASARRESEYVAAASASVNRMLQLVASTIGSIMALGALFAAINSMHSAVTSRTAEIAMLRALGFAPVAVAVAVLLEALLLALFGAVIGAALSCMVFQGMTISTLGGALWDSQLVYSLSITSSLILNAVFLACGLGLLGGAVPAIRVSRIGIADVLREA